MKKYIFVSLLLSFTFNTASAEITQFGNQDGQVFASSTPEMRQERIMSQQQNLEQRRERIRIMVEGRRNQITERREKMMELNGSVKIKLEAESKERVRNLTNNIFNSFTNFTDKLGELENRLFNLIANKESDADMTAAKTKLDESSVMLEEVTIKIESFKADFDAALEDEITKEYFIDLSKEIKNDIIETHKSYQEVIRLINQN